MYMGAASGGDPDFRHSCEVLDAANGTAGTVL